MTITRQELYNAIWKTPACHLAKTYGISDTALRKICLKMNVPKPGHSYWARKQLEQQVLPPPLPKSGGVHSVTIKPAVRAPSLLPSNWEPSAGIQQVTASALSTGDGHSSHPLVQRIAKTLSKGKLDSRGRITGSRSNRYCAYAVLPQNLERAMRIWERIFPAIEAHGCKVTISDAGDEYQYVIVQMDDQLVEIELRDRVKGSPSKNKIYMPWVAEKPVNVRSLAFKICSRHPDRMQKQWTDKRGMPLENFLDEIARAILTTMEAEKAAAPAREEERRRKEEQIQIAHERIEKMRCQQRQRDTWLYQLDEGMVRHEKFQRYTAFAALCEAKLRSLPALRESDAMVSWLVWLKGHIASINPLENGFLERVARSWKDCTD